MTNQETALKLQEVLPFKFRIQTFGYNGLNKKNYITCVAYVEPRVLQQKLDDIFGFDGWQDKYYSVNGSTYCEVSVWSEQRNEWISRSDAGETQRDRILIELHESIKNPASLTAYLEATLQSKASLKNSKNNDDDGFSLYNKKIKGLKGELEHISKTEATDAFKRAVVKIGLGRFLYSMDMIDIYVDGNYLVNENNEPLLDINNRKIYKGDPKAISEYCNAICLTPNALRREIYNATTKEQLDSIKNKMYNLKYNQHFNKTIEKKLEKLENSSG